MAQFVAVLDRFNNWIDSRSIIRRIVLIFTLYLTWHSYMWATNFAWGHADKAGLDIGAVIGAVLLPISYLQKSVFDAYLGSRK